MKRSFINQRIDMAIELATQTKTPLPEFAYFTIDDWKKKNKDDWQEVFDLQLGWDISDFGSNDFLNKKGLLLFTLRNGSISNKKYPKQYAEKMMVVDINQEAPFHFHFNKMEDIINRGGGDLVVEVYHATSSEELDKEKKVSLYIDGRLKTFNPGERIILKNGQGISLPQYYYHRFWAEKEPVLAWEVSMVNDDYNDNRFLDELPRFSQIEEDEQVKWVLCNEYNILLGQ